MNERSSEPTWSQIWTNFDVLFMYLQKEKTIVDNSSYHLSFVNVFVDFVLYKFHSFGG